MFLALIRSVPHSKFLPFHQIIWSNPSFCPSCQNTEPYSSMENMQVKEALEIMRSRNGLCSASTSFEALRHQFVHTQFVTISTNSWAWTGVGTGRACFCSEAGLNNGAREIGGTINGGKFLLAFSWEDISEKVTQWIRSVGLKGFQCYFFFFKEHGICRLPVVGWA